MTDKVQKIRKEVEKLQKRAEHNFDISLTEIERQFWLGESNVLTLIGKYIDSLQEEPVSEELDEAAFDYAEACKYEGGEKLLCVEHFEAGAKWSKKHLWKDAQGDDLPEIDREVIVSLKGGKVAFAHRPYKGKYIGKSFTTGNIVTFENQTYDKGEWNIPDVMYWLDCEMSKETEGRV